MWAGSLTGYVTDAETSEPLPGANIALLDTGLGTTTDLFGQFTLTGLPAGQYALLFSMIGYTPATHRNITITSRDTVRLTVVLHPSSIVLPSLVVSASKRPRDIVDVPTSVTLIESRAIETQNTLSLDQALDYAPGVQMVSGQVNVRGSSGYARGAGSRVLMLIDGFPALSADQGDVKWDAIPVDQIQRVEIIKGAGSALYGTGALGGIINVITKNPSPVPVTHIRTWAGIYNNPSYPQWQWTQNRRYIQGIDISHSRHIHQWGLVLGAGQKWTNGYRENDWHRRYKTFIKIHRAFSTTQTLTATANWAYDDHGVFIQWKDRNEPLEVPASNQNDQTLSTKLNINLDYYHLYNATFGYRIKTFAFRTHFDNDLEGDGFSTAYKFGQEYQLDLQPVSKLSLTVGSSWIKDHVSSAINLFGDHTGYSLSLYGQAEYRVSTPFILSLGSRLDHGKTDAQLSSQNLSPKIGLSYELNKNTSLRSTLGWGFRSPSIAEIYTHATFSGVPIVPNPNLKPESAQSVEIGLLYHWPYVQLDMAGFYSRYHNLIEARPSNTGTISFRNVSKGRIAGFEISAQAALGFIQTDLSCTFLDAQEHLPTGNLPLPYRSSLIAGAGLEYIFQNLTLGSRFTYRSPIKQGVALFPEGTRDLIAIYLLDLSFVYTLKPVTATVTIHNALQYNYAEVERNLGPPRKWTLSLTGTF